jgi:hypothetical protein
MECSTAGKTTRQSKPDLFDSANTGATPLQGVRYALALRMAAPQVCRTRLQQGADMPAEPYDIVVNRAELADARAMPAPPIEIGADQVHVRIDSYALTANNITYGVVGETMQYWSFYPAAAGMGRIPVWGFGTVAKSSRADVAVGERLYGFWPMSSDALLTIGRATPATLTETSPHRRELASVYNSYMRVAADPSMPAGSEPFVSLLRPLFPTSFLIDDFLAGSGFFGAETVLITSASSKTSIGLAGYSWPHAQHSL